MAFDIALKSPNSAFDVVVGIPGAGSLVATRHRRGRSRGRAALSGLSTTYPSQPAAVQDGFTRSNFKVYLWPYDGSSNFQLDASGVSYYNGLGIGLTRDFYDLSGTGAINQTALKTGATNSVDFWAARSEWADILLWWMDIESSYYTGDSGDTVSVPDVTTAVSGAQTQWATHHGTTMYVGSYGSLTGYGSDQTVNTAVAAQLDFSAPEAYSSNIDTFKTIIDGYATKKDAWGITTPLIPIIWIDGRDADFVSERLEYMIRKSAVDGVMLWGTATADTGPTYYDGFGWMQGALAFIDKYGLTIGTPF